MSEDAPPPPPPPPPPSAYPSGYPPAASAALAPLRTAPNGLAVASVATALGLTLLQVASAVAAFPAERALQADLRGERGSWTALALYELVNIALVVAVLATYVVSCWWLHAARTNSDVITPGFRHRRRGLWVWLGWWVPIVSLWFPHQVVQDVRAASSRPPVASPMGLWWTGWLTWLITSRVLSSILSSDDPGTIAMLPVFECIGTVALVAACVPWCRMILGITADQERALPARRPVY